MPFIPTPNTAKLVIKGMLNSQAVNSIFYAQRTGGWDAAQLEVLANEAITAWKANALPLLAPAYTFTGVETRDVSVIDGEVVELAATAPNTGTNNSGGAPLPNSVSLAVKKTSVFGGRGGKGRIFWPITLSGMLQAAGQLVVANYATSVCTALGLFRDAIEASIDLDAELGFVSYYFQRNPRAAGLFRSIVDFVCPDLIVDSQRRRLPGRGV